MHFLKYTLLSELISLENTYSALLNLQIQHGCSSLGTAICFWSIPCTLQNMQKVYRMLSRTWKSLFLKVFAAFLQGDISHRSIQYGWTFTASFQCFIWLWWMSSLFLPTYLLFDPNALFDSILTTLVGYSCLLVPYKKSHYESSISCCLYLCPWRNIYPDFTLILW